MFRNIVLLKKTHWGIQTMLQWVICMQNLIGNHSFWEGCIPVSRAGRSPRHSTDVIRQPYPDAEYRRHSNVLAGFSASLHGTRALIKKDFVLPSVP